MATSKKPRLASDGGDAPRKVPAKVHAIPTFGACRKWMCAAFHFDEAVLSTSSA